MISLTEGSYPINLPLSFHGYNFIKKISKGGYCCVVLVENFYTHQNYAAKIISKQFIESKNSTHLILNEVKILQLLDHPNIIKFYDAFTVENTLNEEYFVIITEYCENGDLFDYIYENEFRSEKEKKQILIGILKALKYLHKNGISHGDIKPENILLDHNYNPKLCDFGFAKNALIERRNDGYATLQYMPPEFLEKGELDLMKSDLYSLGITFFVISEKLFPYMFDDDQSIVECIRSGYLYLNPDDQIQNIVARLTRKNPNDRATIDEILSDKYFNF